jgi:hypothetical protein
MDASLECNQHLHSGTPRPLGSVHTIKAVVNLDCEYERERDRLKPGRSGRERQDGDGIPCENVCSSLSQVEKIKQEMGC